MPQISRAMEREWAAKLAASGFVDLEVGNGDQLSSRGDTRKLGEATRKDPNGHLRAGEKAEYYEWALAALKTHRFASRLERCLWTHHANRMQKDLIASMLGNISSRQVRETIERTRGAIKARQGALVNQVKTVKPLPRRKLRHQIDMMVRRMDLGLLLACVGGAAR